MIGSSPGTSADSVSLEEILAAVMKVPRRWIAAMAVLSIVSCFSIDRSADNGWTLHFDVTALTLGALALIWLPALLRLLSLTGGKLRAAGVEASAEGLLGTPERLIGDLTDIRTEADEAGLKARRSAPEFEIAFSQVAKRVDDMASEYLGRSTALSEGTVVQLARDYETLRSRKPPGGQRTVAMTRVVNEARVRASANPNEAMRLAPELLRSGAEGRRIIGFALLQEVPSADSFVDVLRAVTQSTSAFEMFNALHALADMAPDLSADQVKAAIKALENEKMDPRGVKVMEDAELPYLIDEVLERLNGVDR